MRLFAAIPLPEQARERLMQFRLRTASPKDGLRWSEPEQWHVTLRFFGEVSDPMQALLQEALKHLQIEATEMSLTGLGLFLNKGILFAAIARSAGLVTLQAKVEDIAAATGLKPETRAFHPHITLARSRNKGGLRTLQQLSRPTLPSLGTEVRWAVHSFGLYQSELTPAGAVYTPVLDLSQAKQTA